MPLGQISNLMSLTALWMPPRVCPTYSVQADWQEPGTGEEGGVWAEETPSPFCGSLSGYTAGSLPCAGHCVRHVDSAADKVERVFAFRGTHTVAEGHVICREGIRIGSAASVCHEDREGGNSDGERWEGQFLLCSGAHDGLTRARRARQGSGG